MEQQQQGQGQGQHTRHQPCGDTYWYWVAVGRAKNFNAFVDDDEPMRVASEDEEEIRFRSTDHWFLTSGGRQFVSSSVHWVVISTG